ncbi:MAG: protein kinase [Polyangia bacterium]
MPRPGRYHIARKIADGGMAEIFLGSQHGLEGFERPVVLKRILAPLVADPQFRNMLIDEAHVAMGLNHSNIVQVLDLGHVSGRYFLVLELVDGWDLSQILTRTAAVAFPIPSEIALYIVAEICRALAYAHSHTRAGQPLAIVHRDVSPQNVLISDQGEVKLTDFGIAKAMGRRERTDQGVIKGKLAFMSPEQASGSILDSRSDLFSVGTLLYLLFTGRRPFESPTDLEAITRVRECRYTPPEEVVPGLNAALAQIIRRAMARLPSQRYQSADQMLLAVENLQRTVYRPAGQTELKRWLADLQARDHCPTVSHAPASPVSEHESLDIGEGAEVVFEESVDISAVVRSMEPTIATPQDGLVASAPASAEKTVAAAPGALRRSRVPARIIAIALVLTAAALAGWLYLPASTSKLGQHRAPRSSQGSLPDPGPSQLPGQLPELPSPDQRPLAGPDLSPVAAPGAIPGAPGVDTGVAASPATASDASAAESEEDEDKLLQHAEPNDAQRVLGDDEAVADRPGHRAIRVATEPVSVHVVSVPDGAVLSVGKRVFGRAPMSLRFRPGIVFELRFVKKGYYPTVRRFAIARRKNQTLKVVLKRKAPPPAKSFLRRIFGGH